MREGEPDPRLDLNLVDAGELVFDRILDGEHLTLDAVEPLQHGVKRRRLAASGRSGDQDDAVGTPNKILEHRNLFAREAERGEVELDARPIENAHHHAFAEHGRDRRNAEVDVDAAHRDLDASILWQPALGDVELGHDLDAGSQRGAQSELEQLGGAQQAVDPVAHDQCFAVRFDVDVRGPSLDRIGNELIDQPYDRRLAGDVPQSLDVELAGVGSLCRLDAVNVGVGEQIERVEGLVEIGRRHEA